MGKCRSPSNMVRKEEASRIDEVVEREAEGLPAEEDREKEGR